MARTFRRYCFARVAAFGGCGRKQGGYPSAKPELAPGCEENRRGICKSDSLAPEPLPGEDMHDESKTEKPKQQEPLLPRRVTGKQSCAAYPCPEVPDVDEFVVRAMSPENSPDPRAAYEAEVARVRGHMRRCPLLPFGKETLAVCDTGADLPNAHCAFVGCAWTGDCEDELRDHVKKEHMKQLRAAVAHFPGRGAQDEAIMSTYSAAVSMQRQTEAPAACLSMDRRCLREFHIALGDKELGSLVCFACARRFPFDGRSGNADIDWQTLGGGDGKVLNCSAAELENILGLETYKDRYASTKLNNEVAAERMKQELLDWRCVVTCEQQRISLLCCPEDRRCQVCPAASAECCEKCEVPLCRFCRTDVIHRNVKPPQALSNDLMIYYAPREIFELNATFMELVCASPCLTTMVCFSLEKKYRGLRPMDQAAQSNSNRLAARGNATTFPLPWESILTQLERLRAEEGEEQSSSLELPRLGPELSEFMSVLLKTGDQEITPAALKKFVHAATVRRSVVLELIRNARTRGHRAFRNVCVKKVEARAQALPENDIPAELKVMLPYDEDIDFLQPQKNATPSASTQDEDALAARMQNLKPNAVVLEKSCAPDADVNSRKTAALLAVAAEARESKETSKHRARLCVATGTQMLDQFEPWYFGVAFAYLFKYCTGLPDPAEFTGKPRWRRLDDEPRVELGEWVRIMARRVESQLGRDWVFGFTTWNVLFKSAVNLSRTVYVMGGPVYDDVRKGHRPLSASDMEKAAMDLLAALSGQYVDAGGRVQKVNGDLTKVGRVAGLSSTAQKMLRSISGTAKHLPGTQEARAKMRHEIEAMRVRYGTPIFVTMSPDEAHQLLFVRLSRGRVTDPCHARDTPDLVAARGRDWPPLCHDLTLPVAGLVETLRQDVPTWQERRAILARDPLASVDGFRVLMSLALRHLFGVRFCSRCPDCNRRSSGQCQDALGCGASAVGGVFGRVDAVYVAIEAQKSSGSLHGHAQVFIQCLHQHNSLTEVWDEVERRGEQLVDDYKRYAAHVMYGTHSARPEVVEEVLQRLRTTWPDHSDDWALVNRPCYLLQRCTGSVDEAEDARQWTTSYLAQDVLAVQLRKQHHVHKYKAETKQYEPLTGCRRKDKPGLCKADFPRDRWLTASSHVLCPCTLAEFDMPNGGRKNRLGSLHGPYSHAWLNMTHPALLAALRCNSDVQLPYRLPVMCEKCRISAPRLRRRALLAAQRAQDAQTGYSCDYCGKNQPMAYKEIQEFRKGHQNLHATHAQEGPGKLGRRHVCRFLSDAYCKGIVRGQVECCNLRATYQDTYAVAAESLRTSPTVAFMGAQYLALVKQVQEQKNVVPRQRALTLVRRHSRRGRVLEAKDVALLYALRPTDKELWFLSPYELTVHWDVVPTRVPSVLSDLGHDGCRWDVELTDAGHEKIVAAAGAKAALEPVVDFRLKDKLPRHAVAFDAEPETSVLRHLWMFKKRLRPECPTFEYCPRPRSREEMREENARITSVYFRPWTLRARRATEHVPHLKALRGDDGWETALRQWMDGCILCAESKNYVSNFLSVHRVRPADATNEANSDDAASDPDVDLVASDVAEIFAKSATGTGGTRETASAQALRARAFDSVCSQVEATWGSAATGHDQTVFSSNEPVIMSGDMKTAAADARASQRQAVSKRTCSVGRSRLRSRSTRYDTPNSRKRRAGGAILAPGCAGTVQH